MLSRGLPFYECRRGFEPIPTPKAELLRQEAVAGEGEGVQTTRLEIAYDPQLANGGGEGVISGSGGEPGRETVGNGRGGNGTRSVRAGAEERLPLVRQPLGPASKAREMEGGGLHSVYNGVRGDTRPGAGGGGGGVEGDGKYAGGGGGGAGGGGESRGEARRAAFLREVLLPLKLLESERVRTVMFAYIVFSVRRGRRFSPAALRCS